MALTRRMKLGFGALIAVMGILIALNGSQLTWIKYSQVHTSRTLDEIGASSRFALAVDSMRADIGALSEAVARRYGTSEAKEAFATDGAAAAAALEAVLGSKTTNPVDAAALEDMGSLFDRYRQAGDALFVVAATDPVALANGTIQVTGLGNQLSDAATAFQESRLSLGTAQLDRLGLITIVCLILQVILGSVAFFGGIIFAVLLTRKITGALKGAVSSISSSASELLAVASQVAAGAAQTAASTNETTATVEEVKQAAVLAQEKTARAAELARTVVDTSKSGEMSAKTNVANFERIRADMDVVIEASGRLDQHTRSVGGVITMVNDIAEQSNLLSVNASIEAAKAGEHGKGFAVVAHEVKSLAEQSKQGVVQAQAVLGDIQKASTVVVRAAEQSRETVETGRNEASQAVQNNIARVAVGDETADVIEQISATSRQQLAGMEQIGQAMRSITQATDQSVAGTRQVEAEVKHLQALALGLRRLVEAQAVE